MYFFIGLENFQVHLCRNCGHRGKIFFRFQQWTNVGPPSLSVFYSAFLPHSIKGLDINGDSESVIGIFMQNVFVLFRFYCKF